MLEVSDNLMIGNDQGKEIRFSAVAEEWLAAVSGEVRDSTFMEYRRIVEKYIIPELGNMVKSQITSETVRAFLVQLQMKEIPYTQRSLSPNSVKHIYTILKQVLKYGNHLGYLPALNLVYKLPAGVVREGRCFPEEDISIFTNYLTKTMTPRKYGTILCLYTGMRIGELCALQWKNIDLMQEMIHIRKTVKRADAPKQSEKRYQLSLGFPKTDTSYRDIPIPNHMAEQLRQLHVNIDNEECFFLNGKVNVFVDPRCYQRSFAKWLYRCELSNINFHSLRHSFASRCLQSGCDIKTLSELLGHANPTITLKMYVHTTMDQKRKAVERLVHNKE